MKCLWVENGSIAIICVEPENLYYKKDGTVADETITELGVVRYTWPDQIRLFRGYEYMGNKWSIVCIGSHSFVVPCEIGEVLGTFAKLKKQIKEGV